jgi:hypothetical protein
MQFLNPIELLELENADLVAIDNSVIKKAKRKLFADIDLSDNGHFFYKGLSLSKSDCEKVIGDLEDSNVLEFYSHLATNKFLNDFLVNGNDKLFASFKQEGIYKLPDFIKFISPFFAQKFDKAILKAFVDADEEKLRSILRTQNLLSTADLNVAFKGLSIEIQNRLQQIDAITKDIKNEEPKYSNDDIDKVLELAKELFPIKLLNQLPVYFQSQINKIATSINFLQLAIWNEYNTTSVSLHLLEHLLELNIESVSKPTFQKNYNIVKTKHNERIEQERNEPTLKKWASVILTIQSHIDNIENKSVPAKDILNKLKQLISISEINALPTFANEIRTQIGYSIRSLSISCWNKQNDIKSSLELINFALQLNLPEDVIIKFKQDKNELDEIEKKYKGVLVCNFCESHPPDDLCSISKTIYKETYRSYFPRRVEFSYIDISIPRCKNCMVIHSKGNEKYYLVFFAIMILGVIVGAITEDQHFILGGIIGAFIGWIVGKIVEGKSANSSGIKDLSGSTLSKHPLLVDRMKEGWTFSKPSA